MRQSERREPTKLNKAEQTWLEVKWQTQQKQDYSTPAGKPLWRLTDGKLHIYMGEGESVWGEWGTNRWADYREIYIVCSDCHRVQTLRKEELFAMMQQILLDATSYCNTTEMLWSSLCSFHCFQLCRMNFSSVVDAVTVCMLCLKIARVGCRDFSLWPVFRVWGGQATLT